MTPQLCVWLKYNGNIIQQQEPVYQQGDVGNDFHSLFDVYNESGIENQWVTAKLDATPYFKSALEYWQESRAILQCAEIYIETIGGEGEVWVDFISVSYQQQPENFKSDLAIAFSPFDYDMYKMLHPYN
ncbi:MAG: hypothetical protein QXL57_06220 [Candidatus Bathyarchaeia archaeon]